MNEGILNNVRHYLGRKSTGLLRPLPTTTNYVRRSFACARRQSMVEVILHCGGASPASVNLSCQWILFRLYYVSAFYTR